MILQETNEKNLSNACLHKYFYSYQNKYFCILIDTPAGERINMEKKESETSCQAARLKRRVFKVNGVTTGVATSKKTPGGDRSRRSRNRLVISRKACCPLPLFNPFLVAFLPLQISRSSCSIDSRDEHSSYEGSSPSREVHKGV